MIVTRFAPSPTGFLHLGHAFAALTAYGAGDGFLLRIENIDGVRCRAEFEQAIFEDLSWLGLSWPEPVRRQSRHFADYENALRALDAKGLLYPCFCTRKDIAREIASSGGAPHGPDGPFYPGTCRALPPELRAARIASGLPYALRLDTAKAQSVTGPLWFEECGAGPGGETGRQAVTPGMAGDVVLARKDWPASYHLAVVTDDALQGITLVTRGNDLFAATHIQRLLQALLGLAVPAYAHHRLILDGEGRKFSKREGGVTLRQLRARGVTADAIKAMIGSEPLP